jgi:hypothetical protein
LSITTAKEFFADQLAGEETLAAVSEFVLAVEPGLLGQVLGDDGGQARHVGLLGRRQRHELGEVAAFAHRRQPGQHVVAALHRVQLVGHQQHRFVVWQQRQHLGVGQREFACLDDEQHHVDVGQHAAHGAVQVAVEGVTVLRLEARRVDEYALRTSLGADAGDAVARRLRLVRRDADLLTDKRVEQRALADVGTADDCDQTATLLRRDVFSGVQEGG